MSDKRFPVASPLECILMRPIDEAGLLDRFKEESKRATRFHVVLELSAAMAVSLVGHLQLAMRHPANTGPTVDSMKELIAGIREQFKEAGLNTTVEVIDLCFDRSMDRK